MAAARLNVPAISVTGGPMASGVFEGKKVGVNNVFEAVGKVFAGKMDRENLKPSKTCMSQVAAAATVCSLQYYGVVLLKLWYVFALLRYSLARRPKAQDCALTGQQIVELSNVILSLLRL